MISFASATAPTDNRWLKAFVWVMGLAIFSDLWLVWSGQMSISMRIWIATEQHPTLIGAGFVLTFFLASKLWNDKKALCFLFLLAGHLLTHD